MWNSTSGAACARSPTRPPLRAWRSYSWTTAPPTAAGACATNLPTAARTCASRSSTRKTAASAPRATAACAWPAASTSSLWTATISSAAIRWRSSSNIWTRARRACFCAWPTSMATRRSAPRTRRRRSSSKARKSTAPCFCTPTASSKTPPRPTAATSLATRASPWALSARTCPFSSTCCAACGARSSPPRRCTSTACATAASCTRCARNCWMSACPSTRKPSASPYRPGPNCARWRKRARCICACSS